MSFQKDYGNSNRQHVLTEDAKIKEFDSFTKFISKTNHSWQLQQMANHSWQQVINKVLLPERVICSSYPS